MTPPDSDAREVLARRFHEAYERLAPSFGYETRRDSAVPWESVPEKNRKLMVAVCGEVFADQVPVSRSLAQRILAALESVIGFEQRNGLSLTRESAIALAAELRAVIGK